jgi:uncharacterized membrane protein (DUF373 family)
MKIYIMMNLILMVFIWYLGVDIFSTYLVKLYSLSYEKTHYILGRREYYFCEMKCLCTCFMYFLKIYENI